MINVVFTKLGDPSKRIREEKMSVTDAIQLLVKMFLLGQIPSMDHFSQCANRHPVCLTVYSGKEPSVMNFFTGPCDLDEAELIVHAGCCLMVVEQAIAHYPYVTSMGPREYHFLRRKPNGGFYLKIGGNLVLHRDKKKMTWLALIGPTPANLVALDRMTIQELSEIGIGRITEQITDKELSERCEKYMSPPTVIVG